MNHAEVEKFIPSGDSLLSSQSSVGDIKNPARSSSSSAGGAFDFSKKLQKVRWEDLLRCGPGFLVIFDLKIAFEKPTVSR